MNYRHSYHAGNVADVFKHHVLVQVLEALRVKETGFCVLDTHAGGGVYVLRAPGEFEQGIGALWPERARWPALASYLAQVERLNPNGRLRLYPGSPALIAALLRPQDRAVFLELGAEACDELQAHLAGRGRVAVRRMDAWQGMKAFLPPAENRGLVLIDPPYERRDEFVQMQRALAQALKRWRNGIYLAWYPVKARRPVADLHDAVRALGAQASALEFLTLPTDVEQRLNGSGLVLVNAPWRLLGTLRTTLAPLAERLAGQGGRPQVRVVDLGAGE